MNIKDDLSACNFSVYRFYCIVTSDTCNQFCIVIIPYNIVLLDSLILMAEKTVSVPIKAKEFPNAPISKHI